MNPVLRNERWSVNNDNEKHLFSHQRPYRSEKPGFLKTPDDISRRMDYTVFCLYAPFLLYEKAEMRKQIIKQNEKQNEKAE